MALVLCIGRPCDPPNYNGFIFSEQGVLGESGAPLWGCEVPESEFGQFLIGEDGSPWFLIGDRRAKGKAIATGPVDPFSVYAACKTKGDLVAAAKLNLGLELDESEKRADLESSIKAALALAPPTD